MTVRLRGALPAEELNGLERVEEALTNDPKSKRIVVGVIDVYRRQDHGDGVFEPTVEVIQVELLEGNLRERGVKLLQAAHQRRTGARQLFDFASEEEGLGGVPMPPATRVDVPGPRFVFEPATGGKWWLVLRDEQGGLLARRGGLGVRADLTEAVSYTLEALDAIGDDDLSNLARILMEEALAPDEDGFVGGAVEDQETRDAMGDPDDELASIGAEEGTTER